RHVQKRAGTHAVGILLEPILPIRGAVALAVFQVTQDFLDVPVLHNWAQADHRDTVERVRDFTIAGFDVKEVIPLYVLAQRAGTDLLDYPNTVVRINNAFANLEMAVAVTAHNGTDRGAREHCYCNREWCSLQTAVCVILCFVVLTSLTVCRSLKSRPPISRIEHSPVT